MDEEGRKERICITIYTDKNLYQERKQNIGRMGQAHRPSVGEKAEY